MYLLTLTVINKLYLYNKEIDNDKKKTHMILRQKKCEKEYLVYFQ